MFRRSEVATLESTFQYFPRLVPYENGDDCRRSPKQARSASQHGVRIIHIFQDVVTKNHVERARLKNLSHLGCIAFVLAGVVYQQRDVIAPVQEPVP